MLIAGYVLITKENIIMEEKTRIFESIYKECAEHFSESEDEKYVVGLWSGSGYFLDCFGVTAMDGEDALDKVVAYLTKSDDKALCLDVDEVQKMMDEDTEDAPKDDIDDYANYAGLIYVDATMSGATKPVYVHTENLRVEKVKSFDDSVKVIDKITESATKNSRALREGPGAGFKVSYDGIEITDVKILESNEKERAESNEYGYNAKFTASIKPNSTAMCKAVGYDWTVKEDEYNINGGTITGKYSYYGEGEYTDQDAIADMEDGQASVSFTAVSSAGSVWAGNNKSFDKTDITDDNLHDNGYSCEIYVTSATVDCPNFNDDIDSAHNGDFDDLNESKNK